MLSNARLDRDRPVLAGILWLVGVVVLYWMIGYLFMVWDASFAGGNSPSSTPDPTACPYPFCGIWFPR